MQKEIRSSGVLARLGGDEFGVVLEDCSVDKANRSPTCCASRSRISAFVGKPHV
jgi:GGDEF domain-containing protein